MKTSGSRLPKPSSLWALIATLVVTVEAIHAQPANANDMADGRAPVVFRPSDTRPRRDDARLKEIGIVAYESTRLKLYTDVSPDRARPLPGIIDAVYSAWTSYFGPLPPTREGNDFQVTGYLMADRKLFRRAGLLPEDLPSFLHGRHRELEFWANTQQTDYYLRHLVIHEATHCFMTALRDVRVPYWYLEGIAEVFGTHRVDGRGRFEFGVMPDSPENFDGLRRITLIRGDVAQHRWKSLEDVERMSLSDFASNAGYAWSWALCKFLDAHPRYQARFRELGKHTTGGEFFGALRRAFADDAAELHTEWALFSHQLQWGHDVARGAIDFAPGTPLRPGDAARALDVDAARGWQSSRAQVRQGTTYTIAATGEVTLGRVPKPWISQPQGISIVYSEGRPIGTLLAAIRSDVPSPSGEESMLKEYAIGRSATMTAEANGTLYFRVNDLWGSLADNSGAYRVEISADSARP